MRGYLLINTDIDNRKGHTLNLLKTLEGMRMAGLDIVPVFPLYKQVNLSEIFKVYTINHPFEIVFLPTPFKRTGRLAFVFFAFITAAWLIGEYVKGRCQFVYFRSEYFSPVIILLKILNIPYFYEIHRIGLNKSAQRLKKTIAAHAKGIVVLTEILKKVFSELNENIIVAHDAVDFTHYDLSITKIEARKKKGMSLEAKIALYAGSVQKIKGIDIILQAAEKLPEVQFYIVGRVEENMAQAMKMLPNNVVATGMYSQDEAPYFLRAADLLLLPHPEGPQSQSPMKLFEYMASGNAILSSDLPNIREVLPSENLFSDPGDVMSFVGQIKKYFANPESYTHVSTINKDQSQKFTYCKRGAKIADFVRGM